MVDVEGCSKKVNLICAFEAKILEIVVPVEKTAKKKGFVAQVENFVFAGN